ncbi:MAG: PspC domain-containing protein [Paludibacteraceae bacterium]|nr:PspC domain-containing protein [Paludibacteraceae bacterium]
MAKALKRSNDKVIAGIIGGLADYVDVDHSLARIIFSVLTLFSLGFGGIIVYIICLCFMKD